MSYPTGIRLFCVAQNPANGFPARLLARRRGWGILITQGPGWWRDAVALMTGGQACDGKVAARTSGLVRGAKPMNKVRENANLSRVYERLKNAVFHTSFTPSRMATSAGVRVVLGLGPQLLWWGLGPVLVRRPPLAAGPASMLPRAVDSGSAAAGSPGISTPSRSGVACNSRPAPPGSGPGPPRSLPVP